MHVHFGRDIRLNNSVLKPTEIIKNKHRFQDNLTSEITEHVSCTKKQIKIRTNAHTQCEFNYT